ncbi:hypothetical protein BDR03DRAFT_985126 [Suillus americanus]|nr:hypothetical protein BDR03DRAFT_985126 [Suillus americanus]
MGPHGLARLYSAVLVIVIIGPQRACRPFFVLVVSTSVLIIGSTILCTKLEAASAADQELIMQQPQCNHNVSNEPSGSNMATAAASQSILHHQNVHSREASQHRLNQPRPQNNSTLNATTAFEQLALKARGLYESTPTLLGLSDAALDLMFDWIKYCTVLNNTAVNLVEEHKYLVGATMDTLYGKLKHDRMLSEKDSSSKTPRITLRMFLYVPDEPEDEDVHEVQRSRRTSKMKSTAPSSCRKRKRSLTASPEHPPPAKRYQSLYRSRQSAVPAVLEYKTFEMKRAVCPVSKSGELKMDYSEEPEDIMVIKGWQSHIKAGKPHQGYLGQGLTKFVFQIIGSS